MYVYFGTSPRIIRENQENVKAIFDYIQQLGYRHTSDFVIRVDPDKFYGQSNEEFNRHHRNTIKEITGAEICVFEASKHSLSVGYLINYALDLGKPVIVLAHDEQVPYIFNNMKADKLDYISYSGKNLKERLAKALGKASKSIDIRFNFFITPPMIAYMDWLSEKKRIPRSVYLRGLLEKEMRANKEYQKEINGDR